MKLYTFWRSSASFRVRIALHLKGIRYEAIPKNLRREGGEQKKPDFLALNPQGLLPALDHDGVLLSQSLAIIEYLDELYPTPRLIPPTTLDRARVRAMSQIIGCEIHPLNNLRVLNYLRDTLGQNQEAINAWYRHWVHLGFDALEELIGRHSKGKYCYGDGVTLVDVCLIPQVCNAERFQCDMAKYPLIRQINAGLKSLPAFAAAAPENQPDAE